MRGLQKIIYGILFFCFSTQINAQFNNATLPEHSWGAKIDFDGEYLFYSQRFAYSRSVVNKADANNQTVIWKTEVVDSVILHSTEINDHDIYLLSAKQPPFDPARLQVNRISGNGVLEMTTEISAPVFLSGNSIYVDHMKRIFVGLGACGYNNTIMCMDSLGNHLWSKSFSLGAPAGVTGMISDGHGNVLVTGLLYAGGRVGTSLYKIDASGNILWSKLYMVPPPYNTYHNSSGQEQIYLDADQNIIIGTGYLLPGIPSVNCIIKTDSVGNLLWTKKYEYPGGYGNFINISIDNAGNILQLAMGIDTIVNQQTSITTIVSSGDGSVENAWYTMGFPESSYMAINARYRNPNEIIYGCYGNGLTHIIRTDSLGGGICGAQYMDVADYNFFLTDTAHSITPFPNLITTSNHVIPFNFLIPSLTPYCDNLSTKEDAENGFLTIYPNPFISSFTIEGMEQSTEVKLHNIVGNEIGSWMVDAFNSEINVNGLAPGMYFLSWQAGNKMITRKLLKE